MLLLKIDHYKAFLNYSSASPR